MMISTRYFNRRADIERHDFTTRDRFNEPIDEYEPAKRVRPGVHLSRVGNDIGSFETAVTADVQGAEWVITFPPGYDVGGRDKVTLTDVTPHEELVIIGHPHRSKHGQSEHLVRAFANYVDVVQEVG